LLRYLKKIFYNSVAELRVIYSCFVYAGIVVCADASGIFFSRT
jgi:hypothetical protein